MLGDAAGAGAAAETTEEDEDETETEIEEEEDEIIAADAMPDVDGGAGYDDAWEAAGNAATEPRHTFRLPPSAGSMRVRLDYVLLSEGLAGTAAAAEVTTVEEASNHSALTVDLRLH